MSDRRPPLVLPASNQLAAMLGSLLLAVGWSACDAGPSSAVPNAALPALQRRGPLGSLRDFVLYRDVVGPPGAALLVDRFEATEDDWAEFARSAAGQAVDATATLSGGIGALPASGMDLHQARAFARWRLGRLPTESEWRRATVGGGGIRFPWGKKEFATHANTADLGLGELTPVGTFESGRRAGGNAPYDLIGNVSEWTETVPMEWCELGGASPGSSYSSCRRQVLRQPVLSSWSFLGLLPPAMMAAIDARDTPRRVVGADFETPMRDVFEQLEGSQLAGERRQRTGLRVYTTVDELLARLLTITTAPTADERMQLHRFVARARHREVMADAFAASPLAKAEFPSGSIADVLASDLRQADLGSK